MAGPFVVILCYTSFFFIISYTGICMLYIMNSNLWSSIRFKFCFLFYVDLISINIEACKYFIFLFNSPDRWPCELLPSLDEDHVSFCHH
jgi:hypothetical protein